MIKHSATKEFFSIPYKDKYIIYVPLRQLAFLVTPDIINIVYKIHSSGDLSILSTNEKDKINPLIELGLFNRKITEPSLSVDEDFAPTYVTLLLTTKCNLRCIYCYASGGEKKGTTLPFELLGAPFINSEKLKENLEKRRIKGCAFRIHNFIPTFHKFEGELCNGLQLHITDLKLFKPVETALFIFDAIMETSPEGSLIFNPPPYEYESRLMPFDILSGDSGMRECLVRRNDLKIEIERWRSEIEEFSKEFRQLAYYPG